MACRREALQGQYKEQGVHTTVPSRDQLGPRGRAILKKLLSSAPRASETVLLINSAESRGWEETCLETIILITVLSGKPRPLGVADRWAGHPG